MGRRREIHDYTSPAARERAAAAAERNRRLTNENLTAARMAASALTIPAVADEKRRKSLERRPREWLRWYQPIKFWKSFTADQWDVLQAMISVCRGEGSKIARAAFRYFGKTTLAQGAIEYAICLGLKHFPVLLEETGAIATRSLIDIKTDFEISDPLCADYPEICAPIRALQGSAARGAKQTYRGVPTAIRWGTDWLRFPHVPGSPASGSMFISRGMDGAIRGPVFQARRPDLVLINDPQTRESAHSVLQTNSRREIIDGDVFYLGTTEEPVAQFYLGTIIVLNDLTDEFTDPAKRPAWQGKRIKFLKTKPDREDLWLTYIDQRRTDQRARDPNGRTAHKSYLANRKIMNAGAVLSDVDAYDHRKLDDGSRAEISALQHFYNQIADSNLESVNAELQNEPSTEGQPETAGLTLGAVQQHVNHIPRGHVPEKTDWLVAFIDVGGRQCDWAIGAVCGGAVNVIDYGEQPVRSPLGSLRNEENQQALEIAIGDALREWRDTMRGVEWPGCPEGVAGKALDLVLIDSGWRPEPAYKFCAAADDRGPIGPLFIPSKGLGTSRGQSPYRVQPKRTGERRPGEHFFGTRQRTHKLWLYNLDVDFFKRAAQDGFFLGAGQPGSTFLFGDNPTTHWDYAKQILAEEWRKDFIAGKGIKEFWDVHSPHNHKLDATAGLFAAAAILGAMRGRGAGRRVALAAPGRSGGVGGGAVLAGGPRGRLDLAAMQNARREGR